MLRRRSFKTLIALALAITVVSIVLGQNRGVQAWLLGARGFVPDSLDQRILVEPRVDNEALSLVRDSLDVCIHVVERAHGQPFPDRVRVHLSSTQESFNKRTAASRQGIARGAVFVDRLFLSPRAFATNSSVGVLKHELSHLHFRQVLGTAYTTEIPGWFQEGMAVFVANGGGAEPVSKEQAIQSMLRGERFSPDAVGSAIPRGAAAYGLGHHMFYRQAELFVRYLAETYPDSFGQFISLLLGGNGFQSAFVVAFGQTISEAWESFIAALRQAQYMTRPG